MHLNELFGKKEPIDAKQFYEINHGRLKNPVAISEAHTDKRTFWNIQMPKDVLSKYRISEPFELLFCVEERKIFILHQNTGIFYIDIDGVTVPVSSSGFVGIRKSTIMGDIPLVYAIKE